MLSGKVDSAVQNECFGLAAVQVRVGEIPEIERGGVEGVKSPED